MGAKVAIGPSPHACSNIGSGRPLTSDEGCCCGSIRDPNAFKPTQNHPGTPSRKKAEGQANGCRHYATKCGAGGAPPINIAKSKKPWTRALNAAVLASSRNREVSG